MLHIVMAGLLVQVDGLDFAMGKTVDETEQNSL